MSGLTVRKTGQVILRTMLPGALSVFFLVSAVRATEAPIAWQENFNQPNSPADGKIFYEDRGSGKTGDAVVINEVKDGILRFGLKHDPSRKQDRLNLYFGKSAWWSQETNWGPFDMRKFPFIEIKWRGTENAPSIYYCVETLDGKELSGYTWPKKDVTVKDSQGQEWNIGVVRLAGDTAVPTSGTSVTLKSINFCIYSYNAAEKDFVAEIDYIKIRGFTPAEQEGEKAVVESFRNFPKDRWPGFDSFFPFGVYGVGFLMRPFESWGGDYEGACATYGRNRLNFVATNYGMELGRVGGGVKGFIEVAKRTASIAEENGLKTSLDVRHMMAMDGRQTKDGYQQLLPVCREIVSAFPNDKTMVAWVLADEPGVSGLLSYGMIIRAIRETDPLTRPELIVFNNPAVASSYANYLQLNYWDSYPGHNPWSIRDTAKGYRKAMPGKPIWAVLPSFESIPPNKGYDRNSGAEMRLMAYLALAEGAKGLIWFHGWIGSGDMVGLVTRTGNPYAHYLSTLEELACQIIPVGKLLLSTEPQEEIKMEITQEDELPAKGGISVSVLKDRGKPLYYLVAINEDLGKMRQAQVKIPPSIVPKNGGLYDLFKLDGANLLKTGNTFSVDTLAGGDGRIYLLAGEKEFISRKNILLCERALEDVRVILPDLTIAKRWGCATQGVESAITACRSAANKGDASEARKEADSATRLLKQVWENNSGLNSTRRSLSEISREIDVMTPLTEYESKHPKWWTGQDSPMLVPNPAFLDLSKKYWELGRKYNALYTRYLKGEKEGLGEELAACRLTAINLSEESTVFLKDKLKPLTEPEAK